jgi:adenylosuccinate synthase
MLTQGRATIVMGVQFGDEGKGKIIDVLSERADLVCRVQGGNNAGHTIWIGEKKVVTHLLPSGILRPEKLVAIGAGVVLDPMVLLKEIDTLTAQGVPIGPDRLWIDHRAHVIMPLHKDIEHKSEKRLAQDDNSNGTLGTGAAIGTTGRGIGPAYASKALRDGPRVCDIISPARLEAFFNRHPSYRDAFKSQQAISVEDLLAAGERLSSFATDAAARSLDALAKGARVLIEGAQGSMLDVAFGTYPYVTSSSLVSGSATGGLGIPPTAVSHIIGVTKAYATRVGNGPFPGELSGTLEGTLREKGKEFGATTGRPRRVGWLDLVALRYFARINGLTDLVLMKSDVLGGFDQVGLVTDYVWRSSRKSMGVLEWPSHISQWDDLEAVISFVPGWTADLSVDNTLNEKSLRSFIETIEQRLGVPVRYVSTGPERSQGVWVSEPPQSLHQN